MTNPEPRSTDDRTQLIQDLVDDLCQIVQWGAKENIVRKYGERLATRIRERDSLPPTHDVTPQVLSTIRDGIRRLPANDQKLYQALLRLDEFSGRWTKANFARDYVIAGLAKRQQARPGHETARKLEGMSAGNWCRYDQRPFLRPLAERLYDLLSASDRQQGSGASIGAAIHPYTTVFAYAIVRFGKPGHVPTDVLSIRTIRADAEVSEYHGRFVYHGGPVTKPPSILSVLAGGDLTSSRRDPATRLYREEITFSPLQAGQLHTLVLRREIVAEQEPRSEYTFFPEDTIYHTRVAVQFHPESLPAVAWRVDNVDSSLVPGIPTKDNTLPLTNGEASAAFPCVLGNKEAGVAWSWEPIAIE